jgi:hypothetical protein
VIEIDSALEELQLALNIVLFCLAYPGGSKGKVRIDGGVFGERRSIGSI